MTNSWTPAQIPSQANRRFFITGANSGIGYRTAVELARHGATVVLACRDRTRGEQALRQLKVDATGPESAADSAELVILDLASLESVRQVAEAEVARNATLHGLINNAGIFCPPKRRETVDGFEVQFGTNVLGHFALTCRLLPALDAARIVTLSSVAQKTGQINFDDLQSIRSYNPRVAYGQSKLADLMFSFELERRLRAGGFGAVSIAAHPGVAQSNLFKFGSGTGAARLVEKTVMGVIRILMNDTAQGALPVLFAATAPEAKGGAYYGPQGFQEIRGGDVGPAKINPTALDVEAQERLWEVCEQLTGCSI